MAEKIGDELMEFEAKVEHTTGKAWLLINTMTSNQAWLPKSIGNIVREVDPEGNTLFNAPEWWMRRNKFI